VGSSYYIAPEVFLRKYNKECDLWSAGVILYMLIVGSPPFCGENDKKVFSNIKTGIFDKNDKRWINASNEVKDLICKLLVYEPKKRLTANEALQHLWFQKTNSNILFYNIPKYEIMQCIENILSYNIKSKFEEIVLAYIVHNLPKKKEKKTAIKLFKLVNTNGDGKLQKNELKNTLLNFVSEEYLINFDNIFNLLDGDNHGYIEYDEFLRAALDKKTILTEDNIKYAFNFFDKENNGFITKEEIKLFFLNHIDQILFNQIFDEIDTNKDGKIDFQEFKNMMVYD
jgi:calcium-dependent protein kinase